MGTYKNCYDILADVREALNEYSDSYVQGTDTSGTYQNRYLVRKINEALGEIFNRLLIREEISEEFVEEVDLTGVDSVFTLPANFGKLIFFKDTEGQQVFPISQRERRLTNEEGSQRLYYRKGSTLVLDKSGVTETYTLIYYRKAREIDTGSSADGGSLSITLASTAKKIADYYNGMMIENITDDWVDTISDYSAARVATIGTETGASSKYYGIVPDIPEPFHKLIADLAVEFVKAEYPVAQEKPGASEVMNFDEKFEAAIAAYTGQGDTPHEDYFLDDVTSAPLGIY